MVRVFKLRDKYLICNSEYFSTDFDKCVELGKEFILGNSPFSWVFLENGKRNEYTLEYNSNENEVVEIDKTLEQKILNDIPSVMDFVGFYADTALYRYELHYTDNGLPYIFVGKLK
jgi:hypothetical protein